MKASVETLHGFCFLRALNNVEPGQRQGQLCCTLYPCRRPGPRYNGAQKAVTLEVRPLFWLLSLSDKKSAPPDWRSASAMWINNALFYFFSYNGHTNGAAYLPFPWGTSTSTSIIFTKARTYSQSSSSSQWISTSSRAVGFGSSL